MDSRVAVLRGVLLMKTIAPDFQDRRPRWAIATQLVVRVAESGVVASGATGGINERAGRWPRGPLPQRVPCTEFDGSGESSSPLQRPGWLSRSSRMAPSGVSAVLGIEAWLLRVCIDRDPRRCC